MVGLCDEKLCTGCSACMNVCAHGAISMTADAHGFFHPIVDENKCVSCGLCVRSCPPLVNIQDNGYFKPRALAAWHDDIAIRMDSSSGGAFSALAEAVIKKGGVVYGAAWKKAELEVEFVRVTEVEQLYSLRKSKYIPSHVGNAYRCVTADLRDGRFVLFSGTPCQIAGLIGYMGKRNTDKLFTVDFICHGVPSPMVFRKYIESIERKIHDRVDEVNFRDKSLGVETNLVLGIKPHSATKMQILKGNDISFYRGFVNNIYLRESCYHCAFNKLPRRADITLADYRGLGDKKPFAYEKDRTKGFTGVIINSERGEKLVALSELRYEERPFEELTEPQEHLRHPAESPSCREAFFHDFEKKGYDYAARRYMPFTGKMRIILWMRILLRPSGFYALGRMIKRMQGKRKW